MTCYVGLLCYSSNHRNSCNHIISLDKCELIEGPNALISSPSLRPFFCPIQQSANSLIQFGAAPLELRSGAPPPPTLQRHSLGSRHSSFITAAHSPLRLLITSWGWDELSEILMRVSSLRGSRAAQDLARRSIRHPLSRVESLHDFCFSSCCLKVRPDDYALACANDIPVVWIPCHQGVFFGRLQQTNTWWAEFLKVDGAHETGFGLLHETCSLYSNKNVDKIIRDSKSKYTDDEQRVLVWLGVSLVAHLCSKHTH